MALRSSSAPPTCHRCGRLGHMARECSLHTCFRCNSRGHMAWECGEGMTCSLCDEKGHIQRNCKNVSCHKCGRKGHISKYCNDPFAKAREVEKQERLARQHGMHMRNGDGFSLPYSPPPLPVVNERRHGSSSSRLEASGPWDRLGGGSSFGFRGGGAIGVRNLVAPRTSCSSGFEVGDGREEARVGAPSKKKKGLSVVPHVHVVRVMAKANTLRGCSGDGGDASFENFQIAKVVKEGSEQKVVGQLEDSRFSLSKRKVEAYGKEEEISNKKVKAAAAREQSGFALEQLLGYGSEEDDENDPR